MPSKVFLMTDKKQTKDLQCTYPGCDNFVRVNTFYAPAKAKCPDHGGKALVREPVAEIDAKVETKGRGDFVFRQLDTPVVEERESPPKRLNKSVGQLCCPVCDTAMDILAVDETGRFVTFGCPEAECLTSVEVGYRFRHMIVRHIPEPLGDAIAQFNRMQVIHRVSEA